MAENLLAKLEQIEARDTESGGPKSQPRRVPPFAVSSASAGRPWATGGGPASRPAAAPEAAQAMP